MKLKKLLKDVPFAEVKGSKEIEITGLSTNSKVIAPGNLFIALRGENFDGSEFIPEALSGGASAVLVDMYNPFLKKGITQIVVPRTRDVLGALAGRFYDEPSKKLFTIGITGTNGKTTSSFLVRHLLEKLGCSTGLIGTISYVLGSYELPASHTTPDVLTVHKLLKEMTSQSCEAAVMEVSSHGLVQKRVAGVHFDVGLFTNISPEHLDYHKDMSSYRRAKELLFVPKEGPKGSEVEPLKWAVLNADEAWIPQTEKTTQRLTYGLKKGADLRGKILKETAAGTDFEVHFKGNIYQVNWPLIGAFNVSNALGSLAVAHTKGFSMQKACEALQTAPQVPGRLERVEGDSGVHVFVDYAHTDDALKQVLLSLTRLKERKIITVFGCGGGRDTEKRERMAKVAEKYSDKTFITSDNPRMEDPEAILNDIEKGFRSKNFERVSDRAQAIQRALAQAEPGDIVLIAGKGHEKYQIKGHQTIPFDDVAVAKEALNGIPL